MSSTCLCDLCGKQAGTVELGNWCCLAPGMGRLRHRDRKICYDNQNPRDVCRFYVERTVR